MATFDQIKEVRLIINDPEGFINLLEVAALPVTYAHQTAYKLIADGVYYEEGDVALDLQVSDDRISAWYDEGGLNYAVCQAIQQILNKIGRDLLIARSAGGAESTDFVNLTTLRNYYEALKKTYTEEAKTLNTGIWVTSKAPTIAGGEI